MDVQSVEAVLAEVGKAFRLCRFYPSTHPSVQQALSELAAALPALTAIGLVDFAIAPTGFILGTTPIARRNPPVQELAGLLYAQGHRGMQIQPGVTADEFAALIRMAGGTGNKSMQALGAQATAPPLPHIKLEKAVRRMSAAARAAAGGLASSGGGLGDGSSPGRRSTGVFRPDALPPDIEASRLVTMLEVAAPAEAPRMLTRLAEVSMDLADRHDVVGVARTIRAIAHARASGPPEVAEAARQAMAACVTSATITALVSSLADARRAPDERDTVVQALGALGAPAIPLVADSFLTVGSADQRDVLLAVVRLAGEAAVAPIASRVATESRPEAARAYALFLGVIESPSGVPILGTLLQHRDAAVRAAAVTALARIGGPEADRSVAGALRDPSPSVRIEAARGITWAGDRSVSGIVMARLKEETEEAVVVPLLEALGQLKEVRSVALLSDLARGVSGVFQRHPVSVRAAAIRALGRLGTPEARTAVEAHRNDRTPELRAAALEALR
jgi:HEAT repeat protein